MRERLFVAVPLPREVRDAIGDWLARAPAPLPGRPVPPRNWHLTLRFLGDTEPPQRERLLAALRAARLPTGFPAAFGEAGAFPRAGRATVFWLGLRKGGEQLMQLAGIVEESAIEAGFAPESRPFRPHLTLSRLRPPRDVSPLIRSLGACSAAFVVDAVAVYRSVLGGGPARYDVVERFG